MSTNNLQFPQGPENPNDLKPLYLTTSLSKLDFIAKHQDIANCIKSIERLPPFLNKMKKEIFRTTKDQEKCYVLCRRYLELVKYFSKREADKHYVQSLFGADYLRVEKIMEELTRDLKVRYAMYEKDNFNVPKPEPAELEFAQLERPLSPNLPNTAIFQGPFIEPNDLYMGMVAGNNLLIADVRPSNEFMECRIKYEGCSINIPPNIVSSGMSANAIGQYLDDQSRHVWDRRDSFEVIIIVDTCTMKCDYFGSKVMLVRDSIIKWDCNRNYSEPPVVLNGGLKSFIESYPSEVTSKQSFLTRFYNTELEELLYLEDITYPEPTASYSETNVSDHSRDQESNPIELNRGIDEIFEELPPSQSIRKLIEKHRSSLLKEARLLKPKTSSENVILERLKRDSGLSSSQDEAGEVSNAEIPEFDEVPERLEIEVTKPAIDRTRKPNEEFLREIPLPGKGFTSLKNISNNCFMNAMMQSFKVLPPFKSTFVTSQRFLLLTSRSNPAIILEFQSALKELWGGTHDNHMVTSLLDFRNKLIKCYSEYADGRHEDASEFFMVLMALIGTDTQSPLPVPSVARDDDKYFSSRVGGSTSFYVDMFYYQFKDYRSCKKCRNVFTSYEVESSLMLPLPEEPCRLENLMAEYMVDNNIKDYACVKCFTIGGISLRKQLVKEPTILAIFLKRYKMSPGGLVKNSIPVYFPKNNLRFGNSFYKLYAIIQHIGTLGCGHYYTTVLLDEQKDHWYRFNDENITPVHSELRESALYPECAGLFYVKQTTRCDTKTMD